MVGVSIINSHSLFLHFYPARQRICSDIRPCRLAEIIFCAAITIVITFCGTRMGRSVPAPPPTNPKPYWHYFCLTFAAVSAAILFWRYLHAPLMGFDTYFRWDFLAEQILKFGRYDFYPPQTADDFRHYFYVDAIPPAVSFSYWWLYAAANAHVPKLTVIPITLQYISTLGLVYETTKNLASRAAASFALAALASSTLFFSSVAIGQETGLTALALAGVIFLTLTESPSLGACIIAGMIAALAALSREYGWAFLLCGFIPIIQTPQPFKRLCAFLLTSIIFASPWYIRTWALTGNPFYPMPFLGLRVNSFIAAHLRDNEQYLGVTHWSLRQTLSIVSLLFKSGFVQWSIGACCLALLCKKSSKINFRADITLSISLLIVMAVWLYSAGQTDGGPEYSTRVLTPAMVLLSITAGVAITILRLRWLLQLILVAAIVHALLGMDLSAELRQYTAKPLAGGRR